MGPTETYSIHVQATSGFSESCVFLHALEAPEQFALVRRLNLGSLAVCRLLIFPYFALLDLPHAAKAAVAQGASLFSRARVLRFFSFSFRVQWDAHAFVRRAAHLHQRILRPALSL